MKHITSEQAIKLIGGTKQLPHEIMLAFTFTGLDDAKSFVHRLCYDYDADRRKLGDRFIKCHEVQGVNLVAEVRYQQVNSEQVVLWVPGFIALQQDGSRANKVASTWEKANADVKQQLLADFIKTRHLKIEEAYSAGYDRTHPVHKQSAAMAAL